MNVRLELKCQYCGTAHLKLPCQMLNGRGKFCSKECANKSRQNGSVTLCKFCKTEFYRRFGEQKGVVNKFCSNECYSNYRILNAKKTTYLKSNQTHKHIVVCEKVLKRKLLKGEIVHHIDLNKKNNSIENLAILPSQSLHAKIHFSKIPIDFEKYKLINIIKNV